MAFFKVAVAVSSLLAAVALTSAEPPNNQYLPPTSGGQQGYNYDRPPVAFPPRPTQPAPAPRPQPQPSYSPPTNGGYDYNANANLPGSNGGDHDDHHHHEPGMPYDFNYAVKDDYYGTDYSRNEVSDGDVIRGEYRVQLPDGRLQIVRYTADWKNGYNADVSYEGEAKYPEPSLKNTGYVNNAPQQQPSNGGYQYRK